MICLFGRKFAEKVNHFMFGFHEFVALFNRLLALFNFFPRVVLICFSLIFAELRIRRAADTDTESSFSSRIGTARSHKFKALVWVPENTNVEEYRQRISSMKNGFFKDLKVLKSSKRH